jgi:hypothetical protein
MIHGKSVLNNDVAMIEVCSFMGWDYFTYKNQPSWFIDLIVKKLSLESEYKKWQQKRGSQQ